jgi:hypothetical protein
MRPPACAVSSTTRPSGSGCAAAHDRDVGFVVTSTIGTVPAVELAENAITWWLVSLSGCRRLVGTHHARTGGEARAIATRCC